MQKKKIMYIYKTDTNTSNINNELKFALQCIRSTPPLKLKSPSNNFKHFYFAFGEGFGK